MSEKADEYRDKCHMADELNDNLTSHLADLKAALLQADKIRAEQEKKQNEAVQLIDQFRAEIDNLQQQVAAKTIQVQQVDEQKSATNSQLEAVRTSLAESERQVKRMDEELSSFRRSTAELHDVVAKLKQDKVDMCSSSDQKDELNQSLKLDVEAKERLVEQLKSEANTSETLLKDMKEEHNNLLATIQRQEAIQTDCTLIINNLQEKMADLETEKFQVPSFDD